MKYEDINVRSFRHDLRFGYLIIRRQSSRIKYGEYCSCYQQLDKSPQGNQKGPDPLLRGLQSSSLLHHFQILRSLSLHRQTQAYQTLHRFLLIKDRSWLRSCPSSSSFYSQLRKFY